MRQGHSVRCVGMCPSNQIRTCVISRRRLRALKMRTPGVEPGSQAWGACMMPLHYERHELSSTAWPISRIEDTLPLVPFTNNELRRLGLAPSTRVDTIFAGQYDSTASVV